MIDTENIRAAIQKIETAINTGNIIKNIEIKEICRESGIKIPGGGGDNQLLQEDLEVAVNKHIANNYLSHHSQVRQSPADILIELASLENRLPTQSWRTDDKIKYQQFGTPPPIAFLLTEILKPCGDDLILEPSAGTGALAVWPKIIGCRLHLNELSERRGKLLELQGYAPTAFDAEFLDDLLPDDVRPNAVLMNPPFRSSGGRTKNNNSIFGLRHVRTALLRLRGGGRLAAILGTESGTRTARARKFWNEVASAGYDVRAIINLPKNAFYKYGTSIATSIVCIARCGRPAHLRASISRKEILYADCKSFSECLQFADIFNRS